MNRGVATFTLDYGKCPPWLFERMVKLGREITIILIDEYGPEEFIRRMGDPVWFQTLGTVLAFDWNASGLTTILTAALKEGVRGQEKDLGIFICGGKGKTSLKTPQEINTWGERLNLPGGVAKNLSYNSKMAAKVDSSLVQDGYQIYHHTFFFTKSGAWTVVQQGMNTESQSARRYHWHSKNIKDLIENPHSGIASQKTGKTLNLTAEDSRKNREVGVELIDQGYTALMKDISLLRRHSSRLVKSYTVKNRQGHLFSSLELSDINFHTHPVLNENFSRSRYLEKILSQITIDPPKSYEEFISREGVGPKTVRALSLVAETIYGAPASYKDPARYSFAFGGKDDIPYPVDRETYDKTREIISGAVLKAKLSIREKNEALRKLGRSQLTPSATVIP
ncbi:MAG: DUF763 domain-containing protein [Anaplasmataceae bacterium]|nr:DUF763 domain-containing protein [Anaplasmataceae bacterium]